MTNGKQRALRRSACWLLVGVIFVVPSTAAAQEPASPPVVVTTGEAVVKMAPDRAFVTIAAESRAKTPSEAQKQNAQVMTAVQQRLKEARLPADAIRTLAYDLHPEFEYQGGRQTLRGYVVRNMIEVRLDDLSRVGEIVDLAVGSGATSVSSIRFDLKDRDSAGREALRRAVADARARADAAAAGAGRSVDRVLRIEEQRDVSVPPPRPMMAMRAEVAAAPETPIVSGEIEVRAQVTLTASIK